MAVQTPEEAERAAVLKEYRQKVLQHRETDSKLKAQRSAVKDLVAKSCVTFGNKYIFFFD